MTAAKVSAVAALEAAEKERDEASAAYYVAKSAYYAADAERDIPPELAAAYDDAWRRMDAAIVVREAALDAYYLAEDAVTEANAKLLAAEAKERETEAAYNAYFAPGAARFTDEGLEALKVYLAARDAAEEARDEFDAAVEAFYG